MQFDVRRAEEPQNMRSAYASWIGQAVVLQVLASDLRVPLRGVVVGESEQALRFRVGDGWDIDIFKTMILAVEQDGCAMMLT
jgi:hypothetical protein